MSRKGKNRKFNKKIKNLEYIKETNGLRKKKAIKWDKVKRKKRVKVPEKRNEHLDDIKDNYQ